MKKINCPFCKIRLDSDDEVWADWQGKQVDISSFPNIPIGLYFCTRKTCPSKFNVEFDNTGGIIKWSFHCNNIKMINNLAEDYCYCSKSIETHFILKPRLNGTNNLNLTSPMIKWETLFESKAWDIDPFDAKILLEKLNFCLTFS